MYRFNETSNLLGFLSVGQGSLWGTLAGARRVAVQCGLAAGMVIGTGAATRAATVSSGGSVENIGLNEHSYDGDGYLFFGTSSSGVMPVNGAPALQASYTSSTSDSFATFSLPSYVKNVSPIGIIGNEAYGYGYSNIQPTSSATSVVQSGLAFNNTTAASTSSNNGLLTITFSSSGPLPSTVRVGVLVNNDPGNSTTNFDQLPVSLTVQGPGGVTDTATQTVDNTFTPSHFAGSNDLYFFNLTPTAGAVFTLSGVANTNGYNPDHITIGGLTFSTPEPASFGLLGIGCIALVARRRDR